MLTLYAAAIVVGAVLLFWIQLLFARMILPLMGGAPAVWNTCMVFFQAILLAGYVWAHLSTRWLGTRRQSVVHLVLLAAAFVFLPIGVPSGWAPPASANPAPWLVMTLAAAVGLPALAVSATSPLLQKWFARTGHHAAGDPYFLYSAGSLGNLLILVGYPTLLEPSMDLRYQSLGWTATYALLALLIAGCAVLLAGLLTQQIDACLVMDTPTPYFEPDEPAHDGKENLEKAAVAVAVIQENRYFRLDGLQQEIVAPRLVVLDGRRHHRS